MGREGARLQSLQITNTSDARVPPISAFLEASLDFDAQLLLATKSIGVVTHIEESGGRPMQQMDANLQDSVAYAAKKHAVDDWMHVVSKTSHHASNLAALAPVAVMLVSAGKG